MSYTQPQADALTRERWHQRLKEVLDLRAIPTSQRARVFEVADALFAELSQTPIAAWQPADLDRFLRERSPHLDVQARRDYAAAFAFISESLFSPQTLQSAAKPKPQAHLDLDLLIAPAPPEAADTWVKDEGPMTARNEAIPSPALALDDLLLDAPVEALSPAPAAESAAVDAAEAPPRPPATEPPTQLPDRWSSPRRIKASADKRALLIDDRYTLHVSLPAPQQFNLDQPTTSQHIKSFAATYQAFPKIATAAPVFAVVWVVCVLLDSAALIVLAALPMLSAAMAWFRAFSVVSRWVKPSAVGPETTALQYLALIRLGLPNHARDLLAFPRNTPPTPLSVLLDPDRGPLGAAFNTVGPMALRDFWRPRIQRFDDPEWPERMRAYRRRWHPDQTPVETLLSSEDGAVVAVHGFERRSYALLPLILSPTRGWLITDGELVLYNSDLEAIERCAYQHNHKTLDDDQFTRACQLLNLSRLDVNRALGARVISERQAELLFAHLPAVV